MKKLSSILTFLDVFVRLNYLKILRNYDKNAKVIIWMILPVKRLVHPDVGIIYDLVYIKYLADNQIRFRIVFDRNIGRVRDSLVLINLSRVFNQQGFDDWGQVIEDKIKLLEKQGCEVGPSAHEAMFWEDKISMHEEFDRLNIVCPKTVICRDMKTLVSAIDSCKFPIITKIPHGAGSMGITEFIDKDDIVNNFDKLEFPFLIQERIEMTMDARVVIIGNRYFDHYFRVNSSDKWHPTSTSNGSRLEYYDLPEHVVQYLEKTSESLNLRIAAYDITWLNNDTGGEYFILEVSPAYLPNPKCPYPISYKLWKKQFWRRNAFWREFNKELERHRFRQIEVYTNKFQF